MDECLLRRLKEITEEERAILSGQNGIQRERYTTGRDFVVDSEKMLEKGKLIEIRPHPVCAFSPSSAQLCGDAVYV